MTRLVLAWSLAVAIAGPAVAQTARADMERFVQFYAAEARIAGFAPDARTSRDQRVVFLQRVVKGFCSPYVAMKRADPGRPISDEAIVFVRAGSEYRQFWDFIISGGSDAWHLSVHGPGEHLPVAQPLVNPLTLGELAEPLTTVPTVPQCLPTPTPVTPVIPPRPVYPAYPSNEAVLDGAGVALMADFSEAGQPPNQQMFRFAFRIAYDWLVKNEPSLEASIAKHRRQWRDLLGLPVQP